MPPTPRLGDGTVTLRPIALADAGAHLCGEDTALVRWLAGRRSTPDTVLAYIREALREWHRDGLTKTFAIDYSASPSLVGTLDLQHEQPYLAAGQVNLAYGLYPAWRGRGVATRAVFLACRYLESNALASEAVLRIHPENTASIAVAARSGFRYSHHTETGEGTLCWYLRRLQ